ncbi:MAG: RNA-directed DNA polymerase [Gammaproteobacteria bacterium]|jgi:RNA-directed DNA polymerase
MDSPGRNRQAKGEVIIVRYADDVVLGFQHEGDAKDYLALLNRRFSDFGLAVHPEKTQLLRFGRFAAQHGAQYKRGKPKTFDFLGFTHYCTTKRNGEFKLGRKTLRKRGVQQIKAVQDELRRPMHDPIALTLKWLRSVLIGHMNYSSVPGNGERVSVFRYEVRKGWFKMLRRRSQRHTITWETVGPK